ncbi:MAG: prolipoprotein diacylglyceryl transferase [Deltaproteobacteria bacterium]|nr:prolipoprotein diacylglyceryl transferase [Deltaproteobacteria bacterium]
MHTFFDLLAYSTGALLFFLSNRSKTHSPVSPVRLFLLAAGAFGIGTFSARLLVQFEGGLPVDLDTFMIGFGAGGKSIVGGLLGGILGVKLVKRFLKKDESQTERMSFGDRTVVPIGVGLCIARVGCFLSGMSDDTYGIPTHLPTGWDFGDGISRHPAQIYEIIGTVVTVGLVKFFWKKARQPGDRFGWFLLGFCVLRFLLEFVKIHPTPYFGLSVYQVLCLVGAVWAIRGKF